MAPKNAHKRIMLSRNCSGRIDYCETCDVIEMELGAVSIRVQAEDLDYLSMLLQQAQTNIRTYHATKAKFEDEMLQVSSVH